MYFVRMLIVALISLAPLSISASPLTNDQRVNICKATMAAIMFQPVDIISGSMQGGNARVSYVRASDNQRFVYECKYEGDRVIWRTQFGSRWGRWRDDAADTVIRYKVTGSRVNITEYVGSMRVINQDFNF